MLNWTVSPGATSYVVLRGTNSGGPYGRIAASVATNRLTDPGLPGGTYYYVVRASNSSGTGTNSPEASATVIGITPTLISAGAIWRYFDNTNELGESWRSNSFPDLNWSNGPARLGFGNDGEVTKVASNRQWTTYFRRPFYIPDPGLVTTLDARLTRDDAAVIYLNGAEVWRDTNMPPSVITNQTPALSSLGGTNETNWLTLNLQPSTLDLLAPGWNLLAAEVHQQNLNSSDIGFDFQLTARVVLESRPVLNAVPSSSTIAISWPEVASYFTLYSATNLTAGATWTVLTNAPVLSNGAWGISVPANPSRFYRLQSDP
jgi:hypothetical protein